MRLHAKAPAHDIHMQSEVVDVRPVVDPAAGEVGVLYLFSNGEYEILEATTAEYERVIEVIREVIAARERLGLT